MAQLTATGLVADSLATYVRDVRTVFQDALGADLDVSAESPQGQLISGLALWAAQRDEALVAVSNGLSDDHAIGRQQDDLGSLLLIPRLQAARSTVTLTLTGTAATLVPQGSRARTAAGDVFELVADATIGAGGTVDADAQSVEAGPIPAAAASITTIVDLVAGWTGVTNAAAATEGRLRETDTAYRFRRRRVLARNSRSSPAAILAAVLEVDGVTDAVVHQNVTANDETTQGVQIDAGTFLVIVDGGTDAAVAAAIARSKPAGMGMSGATTVQVAQTDGTETTPIQFTRVADVALQVAIDTTIGAGFPANGTDLLTERLVDWFAGTWASGTGDFETGGLGIGQALDTFRIQSPILSVPGHTLTSVTVTRLQGGAAVGTPDLNERYTLVAGNVTIS